jgi:ribosomal protein S18 acetylase RimI-like enzyme
MIRRATIEDVSALIQLENDSFTTDIISNASLRRLLKVASAEILVAEFQHKIIGSVILLFRKNAATARVYSLAVDKQHRREGIAAQLCNAAEKNATKRSLENIILEVHPDNHAAIRFYEKHGYHIFGSYSHFYECGSDAIRMKKIL